MIGKIESNDMTGAVHRRRRHSERFGRGPSAELLRAPVRRLADAGRMPRPVKLGTLVGGSALRSSSGSPPAARMRVAAHCGRSAESMDDEPEFLRSPLDSMPKNNGCDVGRKGGAVWQRFTGKNGGGRSPTAREIVERRGKKVARWTDGAGPKAVGGGGRRRQARLVLLPALVCPLPRCRRRHAAGEHRLPRRQGGEADSGEHRCRDREGQGPGSSRREEARVSVHADAPLAEARRGLRDPPARLRTERRPHPGHAPGYSARCERL